MLTSNGRMVIFSLFLERKIKRLSKKNNTSKLKNNLIKHIIAFVRDCKIERISVLSIEVNMFQVTNDMGVVCTKTPSYIHQAHKLIFLVKTK